MQGDRTRDQGMDGLGVAGASEAVPHSNGQLRASLASVLTPNSQRALPQLRVYPGRFRPGFPREKARAGREKHSLGRAINAGT